MRLVIDDYDENNFDSVETNDIADYLTDASVRRKPHQKDKKYDKTGNSHQT